jgi:Mrp family chromosome partitioning ATPase
MLSFPHWFFRESGYRLLTQQRDCRAMKVVALTSDKGRIGKSTAAVNLACAAVSVAHDMSG